MVKEKNRIRKALYIAAIVLLLAAIAAVALSSGTSGEAPLPEATLHPTPQVIVRKQIIQTEKQISADTLADGLRDMGVLLTEEYYFTDIVSFSSVKTFLFEWKFTESSYLVSYDGVVTAGIDCSEITVEKDDAARTITVTVPPARLQNVDIDPNSMVVYSERAGTGNPISVEDFNNSLIELEATAERKAIERGVLERADENARRIIRSFVASLVDLSTYELAFVTLEKGA